MNVDKAISQISEIHSQLAKAEVFYGYKPVPVLCVGFVAYIVAAVQLWIIPPSGSVEFVLQWLVLGSVIIVIMGGNILFNYLSSGSNFKVQQVSRVFLQFVPSILAGVIISFIFLRGVKNEIEYLPGIWSILFSLGIFSMRPYLPKRIGWVALFYLSAGGILLYLSRRGLSLSPAGMGLTFGTGHIFAALILKLDIQRKGI